MVGDALTAYPLLITRLVSTGAALLVLLLSTLHTSLLTLQSLFGALIQAQWPKTGWPGGRPDHPYRA